MSEPEEVVEDDSSRMTLIEHLAEFRGRLIKVVLAVAIGGLVAWILYPQILDFLLRPYCELVVERSTQIAFEGEPPEGCALFVRDPLEGFATRLKIAAYGGIALAMPVILWQLWRFISPGLYARERRYAIPFVIAGCALFLLGAGLAFWTLPKALGFLQAVGGPNLVSLYSPAPYLSLVTYMMLAFGVGFEFPIVLIFLQMAGILEVSTLRRFRRYAIVGIFVLVAVITPSGDPFSLLALSLPMWFFYEASIVFGWARSRRIARRASQRPA
jgi:sec-independent protein translocase protein TatC